MTLERMLRRITAELHHAGEVGHRQRHGHGVLPKSVNKGGVDGGDVNAGEIFELHD